MATTIKTGRTIDYAKILKNIDEIIEALEFDSMRSAGKTKVNAGTLNELYALRAATAPKVKKSAPVKKEA